MSNIYNRPRLNKEFEADRRWFEKHPDRNYRVRPATASEIVLVPPPPGFRLPHAVASQAEAGARLRLATTAERAHDAARARAGRRLFPDPGRGQEAGAGKLDRQA